MRSSTQKAQSKVGARLLILVAVMCALVSVPALSGYAISAGSSTQPVMVIAVTNNSSREIHHIYLSPVDPPICILRQPNLNEDTTAQR